MKKERNLIWDDNSKCWREENGARICTLDNETLDVVIDNCKEFLDKKNTIYIHDVRVLLEKALEGVADSKDLCDSDKEDVKAIRRMIKGL